MNTTTLYHGFVPTVQVPVDLAFHEQLWWKYNFGIKLELPDEEK